MVEYNYEKDIILWELKNGKQKIKTKAYKQMLKTSFYKKR
jgi:hypothetical protein